MNVLALQDVIILSSCIVVDASTMIAVGGGSGELRKTRTDVIWKIPVLPPPWIFEMLSDSYSF